MKALVVHYTNSKDQMKKLVCFNLEQVNRIYKYGYIQYVFNQDGKSVGLLEMDSFFTAEKAV